MYFSWMISQSDFIWKINTGRTVSTVAKSSGSCFGLWHSSYRCWGNRRRPWLCCRVGTWRSRCLLRNKVFSWSLVLSYGDISKWGLYFVICIAYDHITLFLEHPGSWLLRKALHILFIRKSWLRWVAQTTQICLGVLDGLMLHTVSWKHLSILGGRISQIRKQRKVNPSLGSLSSMAWYVFEYLICLELFSFNLYRTRCISWLFFFTCSDQTPKLFQLVQV